MNTVVRVGDTVRREVRSSRPFVHDLLRHLEYVAWTASPRFIGFDGQSREILSWVSGYVPWSGINEPDSIYSEESVARAAELVRELHDLTAGSYLAAVEEVVCHNDLSPRNTVYRPLPGNPGQYRPVAFLDWDLAAPGLRVHDVAHLCWQWAARATSQIDNAVRLIRVAVDAYGLEAADRLSLVDTMLWWQDTCWRGIQARIDAGDQSARRLAAAGAVESVQADWTWTSRHHGVLQRSLN